MTPLFNITEEEFKKLFEVSPRVGETRTYYAFESLNGSDYVARPVYEKWDGFEWVKIYPSVL